MSTPYAHQAYYAGGPQHPQQAQQAHPAPNNYHQQAQAQQPVPGQPYATSTQYQQPGSSSKPYGQQQAQYSQQQPYNASGYDYAAYYAQQQQWAAYQQQQSAQYAGQQPPPQNTSHQQHYPAHQAPQPQTNADPNAMAAYYQHYAQQQPQQSQYQQPQAPQYQQPSQAYATPAQYSGAPHAAAPAAPAASQQPYAAPQANSYPAQPAQASQVSQQPPPVPLKQPQPRQSTAKRPLPSPSSSTPPNATPPRSPLPPAATRPPAQPYPSLPTQPPVVGTALPRNATLPPTTAASQGSPVRSSGRPLPSAPGPSGDSNVSPASPIAPARTGTLPDGPVKSFRNRRGLPTPGSAIPPSILRGSSFAASSSQNTEEPSPVSPVRGPQRLHTLPSPNASARPLPPQPPQHQRRDSSPGRPLPQPSAAVPLPASYTATASPPVLPRPMQPAGTAPSAVDFDDRPPSSRLDRAAPAAPPTAQPTASHQNQQSQQVAQPQQPAAQPRQQQPLPPQQQQQPQAPPQNAYQQFTTPPQQYQPAAPARQSLIMRLAMEGQQRPGQQQQQQWPSSVPPLPRAPVSYHSRVESDDLKDVVQGTANLDLDRVLDDAPPAPARPLSRARGASVSAPAPPAPSAAPAAPSIAVSAPSAPAVAVRAPSPARVRPPSISIDPAPSISVSAPSAPAISVTPSAPSISVTPSAPSINVTPSAPSINVTPSAPSIDVTPSVPSVSIAPDVLRITLDTPGSTADETPKKVDIRKLQPIFRGTAMQCGGCALPIVGRVISSNNVRWHPKCFKCVLCGELLEHVSVFTHEDRVFCHFDYMENFVNRCHHCKTPIAEDEYVTIEDFNEPGGNRFYHMHHFFCAECGDPFMKPKMGATESESKDYVVHNGHAYCQNCHHRLRYPKCKKCKKPLVENGVEAFGGKWCWECFTCTGCDKPFDDPQVFERDGKPWCRACFEILLRNDF